MAATRNNRELAFAINDVARLLRTFADHEARRFGMTRAKWAVLAMLDLQPITLTRLLDGLADNGLIERRADPDDRRAKRLFLTPAARPLLERLTELGEDLMATALAGLEPSEIAALLGSLTAVKENLRNAVQKKHADKQTDLEHHYG